MAQTKNGVREVDSDPIVMILTAVSLIFHAGVLRVKLISIQQICDQERG